MRVYNDLPRPLDVLIALVLLTRLPLPPLHSKAFTMSARATWAYPVVGLVIGGIGWSVLWFGDALSLPVSLSTLLALGATVIATCAMHEDGLADTADGLWGGTTKARRLEIMRDSRIGTYGVLALILITLARYLCLVSTGGVGLILSAVLSRAGLPALMYFLPHARDDGLAHSVGRPPKFSVALAAGIGIVFALSLGMVTAWVAAFCTCVACALIARAKIGGQTGDILGATQQITELAVLIAITAAMT